MIRHSRYGNNHYFPRSNCRCSEIRKPQCCSGSWNPVRGNRLQIHTTFCRIAPPKRRPSHPRIDGRTYLAMRTSTLIVLLSSAICGQGLAQVAEEQERLKRRSELPAKPPL